MARPEPSDIVTQLDQLVQGVCSGVSEINFPRQILAGSPEYRAIRNAIARLRQKGNTSVALELARLLSAAVPKDRKVKLQLARILWADRKFSEAEKLLEEIGPTGADHQWFSARAATFNSIGDYDSAFKSTAKFRQAAPMVMTQQESVHLPLVAIMNTGPYLLTQPMMAAHAHFTFNYISQYAKEVANKFRFASFWVNVHQIEKVLRSSPIPDLVINNVASGEVASDSEISPQVDKCIGFWQRYCINKPKDVRATARDNLAGDLSKSQRVIVPKTRYYKAPDDIDKTVDEVESEFDYPVIFRAPFFQDGANMHLVGNREEAIELVPRLGSGFFAIEFINNLHKNNMYRKMRGAFIEEDFFMVRVDYGPDWMIHGHRNKPHRIEFYNENPQYLEEEIAICKDPASEFGKPVMRALRELRSTVKLDYFGVDFDITEDGKLIVYEANAAMNFLSKGGAVHPHPKESGDALTKRFTQLLMSRINRPKMAMTR